ncbi:MAG TPA: hypothetical protein VFR95_04520 [Gemmatimonadaceae bacterium]|nr:hypothetical protein [Gemmatimonadaceae bacterium]
MRSPLRSSFHAPAVPVQFLAAFAALVLASACGGDDPVSAGGGASENGTISVVASVYANGTDGDGFQLSFGGRSTTLQPNVQTIIDDVPPGSYKLHLSDVAAGCSADADSANVVVRKGETATVSFDVACYGEVAFSAWFAADDVQVVYLNERGELVPLTSGHARNVLEDWSPDGTHLVFTSDRNGNEDLYSVAIDGTDLRRLTSDPYQDLVPRFSPDGQQIVFHRTKNVSGLFERASLHIVNADGTGERLLLDTLYQDFDPAWARGGTEIVFSCNRFGRYWDLCGVAPDGTGLHRIFYVFEAQHAWASPDGMYVAFEGMDGGQAVWVMDVDGTEGVDLTPDVVSYDWAWSPDGEQLALSTNDAGAFQLQSISRQGQGLRPLTDPASRASDASWSADGARIVFYSFASGAQELWVTRPDGSDARQITHDDLLQARPLWNPRARPGRAAASAALRTLTLSFDGLSVGAPKARPASVAADRRVAAPVAGGLSATCVRMVGAVASAGPCRQ